MGNKRNLRTQHSAPLKIGMRRTCHLLLLVVVWLTLAAPAAAGPAMYDASFIMHAWGNDITSRPPFNTSWFIPMPVGTTGCAPYYPYSPSYHPCLPASQRGHPATGMGLISVATTGTGPAPIAFPKSAFGVTTVGFWPNPRPDWYYTTYATLKNDVGSFFAGGGPTVYTFTTFAGSHTGIWYIQPGPNRFGGSLGLLGKFGARWEFLMGGTSFAGTSSWNMMKALGRGPGDPDHTYTNTGKFYNAAGTRTITYTAIGKGTLWTTGVVTAAVIGTPGWISILHRSGYDTTTPGGIRNIQLVTPALTHWNGYSGFEHASIHIGILTVHVPEPSHYLLLASGLGLLVLLNWVHKQRIGN